MHTRRLFSPGKPGDAIRGRLIRNILMDSARILRGAGEPVKNFSGNGKNARREKKNVAVFDNNTGIGARIRGYEVQWLSLSLVFYSGTLLQMLEAFALSDPGRIRSTNQDTFRVVPELGLYLLADGMGGARGGETASKLAVDSVVDILSRSSHRDAATLLGAVEEANLRVLDESLRNPQLEGMGTTLVAALETGDKDVAIASVGDSRAYLLSNDKLRAITEDQTWVQEVGRTLGLDEEILKNHPMRHVLTMAVGVASSIRIRYYAVELGPHDLMMLSSDGLHGVVSNDMIEQILNEESTLEVKCRRLVEEAHEAGSPDNVTVMLIRAAR